MSSVTTDESTYGSNLWRQPSVMSAASSNLTSSSGGADSLISMDLPSFEEKNDGGDHLSFISHRPNLIYQLMDDLAIIDEIYQTFDDEVESEPYERQVADAARNVAQKKHAADQMCQSEQQHIDDLENFGRYYLGPIKQWINDPSNAEIFIKYPVLCSKASLDSLFSQLEQLTVIHREFCFDLKERLDMWGPTQFISDIFARFYERMSIYETFLNGYPNIIVTLDSLYTKSNAFAKFIDGCISRANNPTVKDLLFYLKNPIARLSTYSLFVTQMTMATEPSHPDYRALIKVQEKFVNREKEWKTIIKDRLAHVRVLEASRTIQGNPATVTTARRLLISGILTQVNMSDPQSTADSRTYLLYNDIFMFCQKVKPNSNSNGKKSGKPLAPVKLQYKGIISLKHAEIVPLSAKLIAKITEVKKPSGLGAFMRKSDAQNPTATNGASLVYGFEIRTNERSGELLAVGLDSSVPVPGHASGNGAKRQLIMRTQTEAEQNAWIALLRKTSHIMTRRK